MKLKQFKKGDYIHRTAPSMRIGDRSFIETAIEFIEVKSGLLFFKWIGDRILNDGRVSQVGLDCYDDDEWDYFPEEYLPFNQEKMN